MPLYEYRCSKHGTFEDVKTMLESGMPAFCPTCKEIADRIFSMPAIKVVSKSRLQFGSGSQGKIIPHSETGGLDIFIPSMGSMEQDEVDYIAEGAKEKEIARVKIAQRHGPRNENQARIQAYTELANRTPKGKRISVLREAIKETGDRLVKGD